MKKTIIYQRIVFVTALMLLILLVVSQIFTLTYNVPGLIGQEALQGTRAQRIAKDALILAYRPADEHAQAISEIQNTLPLWEQEQTYLGTLHNPAIETLVIQSQPDYAAIDTAAHNLLAHPSDMTQMIIIIQHERNYTLIMNQLSSLMQSLIQSFKTGLVVIQCSISGLVLADVVALFLLSRQRKDSKI